MTPWCYTEEQFGQQECNSGLIGLQNLLSEKFNNYGCKMYCYDRPLKYCSSSCFTHHNRLCIPHFTNEKYFQGIFVSNQNKQSVVVSLVCKQRTWASFQIRCIEHLHCHGLSSGQYSSAWYL